MLEFTIRAPHAVPCHLVQDGGDFIRLDDWMASRHVEVLGLDTETNGLDPWEPGFAVRLIQISDGREAWLMEPGEYVRGLINLHPKFVAHFSEAEVRFLGRGLPGALRLGELEPHVIDYQVAQAIVDPRTLLPRKDGVDTRLLHDKGLKPSYTREVSPCLEDAAADMHQWFRTNAPTGQRTQKKADMWGWRNIPLETPEYLTYGAMDAVAVKVLYDKAMSTLRLPANATELAEAEREFILQWDDDNMTFRGQPVDPPYARWLAEQLDNVIAEETPFLAGHGVPPSGMGGSINKAMAALGQEPVKWNEGRDGKPPSPCWDREALSELSKLNQPNPIADLALSVLTVRRAGKFRTTYVEPMLVSLGRDCRIHCSFRSIGTITHRNSASNPPLQQQPKKDQRVRAGFGGVPGWVWVTCDLEQGEPRFAAGLSGDPAFVAAVNTGDVNNVTASAAFGAAFNPAEGKTPGTGSYDLRQAAKAGFLAVCYAVGVKKLSSMLGLPAQHVAEMRANWQREYQVMFSRAARGNQQEFVRLPSGRKVTLWDRKIVMSNGDIITSGKPSRKFLNYETQSAQADYLKACWLSLRAKWNWALAFFMHDEIALFVPEELAEEAARDLKAAMTRPIGHGVMMEADATIVGRTWLPQPSDFDRSELESVDD